ncbi:MAG: hypothetical protein PUJ41_00615, partial [Bacteroidales bacterium]|nr:hypothetical protein [Bacteroidales bacterium]MDY4142220.1 hypothetical protein [Sodaliphilus sp.]
RPKGLNLQSYQNLSTFPRFPQKNLHLPMFTTQWRNTGGLKQKHKNRSPSAKNQSSEIRLSENANKKRAKCEAFHVAPRLFFMFLFLIPLTIRQQSIIYPHKFSTEPENCFFWRRMGLNSAKLSIFAMIIT